METSKLPTNSPHSTTSSKNKSILNASLDSGIVQNSKENEIEFNQNVLQHQLDIMITYALRNGKQLPQSIVKATSKATFGDQIAAFNDLTVSIAPATAESIDYINTEILDLEHKKQWFKIPLYSRGVVISSIALIVLILVSLLPSVNEANLSRGLLASSGLILFYNLLFICSASLLGVMFFLLKSISEKIKNYTLLPVDAVELNATVIIGLISGFIISELFTFNISELEGGAVQIHKMALALLGGFSSDAIFTILKGIVNKAKAIFGHSNH